MTPKDKAMRLISISLGCNFSNPREKEVAQYWQARNIIDEVLLVLKSSCNPDKELASNNTGCNNSYVGYEDTIEYKYWSEVKKEIEKC